MVELEASFWGWKSLPNMNSPKNFDQKWRHFEDPYTPAISIKHIRKSKFLGGWKPFPAEYVTGINTGVSLGQVRKTRVGDVLGDVP